ncbi:Peptidyl-tRNA hydrolase [invertebrate metagenome]|uniref:peptidyl-tRNA hydrolase n=1 Tax=invertebrate metagenome TaxID=1711999 RepID=A0A2H9TCT9_9ZZZZ
MVMAGTSDAVQLIVGLGNPGAQYDGTRHNAGFWFVERLAAVYSGILQPDKKFFGCTSRISIDGHDIRLLMPHTFMNDSGKAVSAISSFYKIAPQSILVAHDDMDLPVGVGRLKVGGGHGGHNGLRDIISSLGNNKKFSRLRLGIDHPGNGRAVIDWVLNKPSVADRQCIDSVIDEAVRVTPKALNGSWQKAVQELHTFTP